MFSRDSLFEKRLQTNRRVEVTVVEIIDEVSRITKTDFLITIFRYENTIGTRNYASKTSVLAR